MKQNNETNQALNAEKW